MRICIPTLDTEGLHSEISEHFGRAPFLTLIDSERQATEIVRNPGAHHAAGSCQTAELLRGRTVDVLVCRGLGQKAFRRLELMGIRVFAVEAPDVASALTEYRSGSARALTSERACHGEGNHHSCG